MSEPFNRYSPHYDFNEERVTMSIDDDGDWVHIVRVRDLVKERDEARAEVERQKAQYEMLGTLAYAEVDAAEDGAKSAFQRGAERQREACAAHMYRHAPSTYADTVRATPLVTEGEP